MGSNVVFMLFFYSEFVYEISILFQTLMNEEKKVETSVFLGEIFNLIEAKSDNITCPVSSIVTQRTKDLPDKVSFSTFCNGLFHSKTNALPKIEELETFESTKHGIKALIKNTMM